MKTKYIVSKSHYTSIQIDIDHNYYVLLFPFDERGKTMRKTQLM